MDRRRRPPQFFKVLFPGTFETRLSIPPKIARLLTAGGAYGPTATLRYPPGRSTRVAVVDDGPRGVSFGTGWPGFLEANSLAPCRVLLFRYDGDMAFTVEVYDESSCVVTAGGCAGGHGSVAAGKRRVQEKAARRGHEDGILYEWVLRKRIDYAYLTMTYCKRVGLYEKGIFKFFVAGKTKREWSVRIAKGRPYLGKGFKEFCLDNGCKERDRLIIQYVGDRRFQVQVKKG